MDGRWSGTVRTTEGEIVSGQSRPGNDLLDVLIDRYRALPRSGDVGNDLRYFTAALTRAVSSASLAPLLASAVARLVGGRPVIVILWLLLELAATTLVSYVVFSEIEYRRWGRLAVKVLTIAPMSTTPPTTLLLDPSRWIGDCPDQPPQSSDPNGHPVG
jgi:hypothetical protein